MLQNEGALSDDNNQLQSEDKDKAPNVTRTRALRPRKQKSYESPEQCDASGTGKCDNGNIRTLKRKEKQRKQFPVDEFSKIKAKLRYFLHRIKYEQNLIDAYSTEGWKGKSLEKIKPEKELERAKSGIFKYKLKIRDLFQCIDMLLAQGRIPESSYDSEGLINSEDIFCAKCSSKDLAADNDIILCDGSCERGFHQLCLEPPLLKEDIPPGDEAWLCPGCVCKLDCLVLLNGLQGTNLSLRDTWEKVFPGEAEAAATTVKKVDDSSGLPLDDSEDDDDYKQEVEEDDSVDGTASSEESDYFSAPEDLEDVGAVRLPFEDSGDEDYDPNVPGDDDDDDAQVVQESSCSDFTSNSEDVGHPILPWTPRKVPEASGNKKATRRKNKKRQKIEGSSKNRIGKSKYGEDAIKRLYECFKENQYPKRDVKEKLASELGLTIPKIHKWFENARRSFNHSSSNETGKQT